MPYKGFCVRKFLQDKRGDALFIFITFLMFMFGMMIIGQAQITDISVKRQKLYNAVQDGLTLARAEAIRFNRNAVSFNRSKANSLIKQCLDNNKIEITSLDSWYSNGRIYASGKTSDGTPFTFSMQTYRNYR